LGTKYWYKKRYDYGKFYEIFRGKYKWSYEGVVGGCGDGLGSGGLGADLEYYFKWFLGD
jgi:hypothetical protein